MPHARQMVVLAFMAGRYWLTIALQVRRELGRWERRARRIPDPMLRAHALQKLRDEHLNAEAAATFATLGTWRAQVRAVRLMVAFEVMYDYLDAVSEAPTDDVLANGLQLHKALLVAIDAREAGSINFYSEHRQHDDGGYLLALAMTCRSLFAGLPSSTTVRPVLAAAARRCGEAQSRTHAVPAHGIEQLSEWAQPAASCDRWYWWEWAAGATASLSMHALFAAATRRETTSRDARAIDAAYNPAICGLATLMDSLIDIEHDDPLVDHSYIAYYESTLAMGDGLRRVTRRALSGAGGLPLASRHEVVVAGIACFYLSRADAAGGVAGELAANLLGEVGPLGPPTLGMLRLRRAVKRGAGFFLSTHSH
jgi:tetraprenyl-beta-curcumene synthase